MKRISLLILFIINALSVLSQSKQGSVWVTGSGGQKVKFAGNNIFTSNVVFFPKYYHDGNSNICDTNGNLILCSNGFNIYDSNGNYIDGGDTLVFPHFYNQAGGWSAYPQSSIFLPMDSNRYYFVTPSKTEFNYCFGCHFDVLLYSVINMNANGGAGKVEKRMQPLLAGTLLSRAQMMACRHSNGKDWWLLKQGGDSNIVHKFLFKQDTVEYIGFQKFDAPMWSLWDIRGQSVSSKDGGKYATTVQGISTGEVFIADFDRCYGALSNPQVIIAPIASMYDPTNPTYTDRQPVGLAYSPNGKLLYVICQYNIWQYDFDDLSWYHAAGLDTSWQKFQGYANAYLGPDNKLYVGNFGGTSKQMSVIDNPDVKGVGCNFCPRCLRMDTLVNGYAGTPPCMPNYSLGAQNCWPLSNSEFSILNSELIVYPNPANTVINIKMEGQIASQGLAMTAVKKELYNSVAQLIFSTTKNEIDVSRYSTGVYYIKVGNAVRKIIIE